VYNFARALDRNADRWPDKEAIVFEGRRITNRQLDARVNALAAVLLGLGVERGDVVAILLHNCPEFLEATVAINKIGAVFLPLNFRLAAPEWRYIIGHAEARALITEPEFVESIESFEGDVPSLRDILIVNAGASHPGDYESALRSHLEIRVPTVDVLADDVQRLMYTSGTTARPKGVALTYGNVLWKIFSHIVEFGIGSADRVLLAGPMYHVGALDLPGTGVLYVGGSTIVLRKFDAAAVMRAIEVERATAVWLAPAMVNAVLNLPDLARYDTSSMRFIINGGEKMPSPLIERLLKTFPTAWFADAYGLTETVSGDTFLDREHVLSKIGSVGKPVVHLDIRIVDEDNRDLGADQLGEILLRGPKVFSGYWKDPDATRAAFVDGWFRTGDIGRIDADGYLYIEDRKKDMIKSGGENIASPEIERVLYMHAAVLEAAVVGVPDARWGEVPKAFVVAKPGKSITSEELIAFCASQLAKFKVPKSVEFLDELPRNPSGKVLKRQLRSSV
jgi:acyl-CoA synthetase (AMP-forming)/AMP-acid ligase II